MIKEMRCNRRGCKNCMCNRINEEWGFICEECFDEMCNSAEPNAESIQAFMDSPKKKVNENQLVLPSLNNS